MASSSSQNTFDDTFDDTFDELFDQAFENFQIQDDQEERRKKEKKRVYIERHRGEAHNRLWNDYFSETPTYPHNLFRRRFRMNKSLFMHIVERLSDEVQFFRQKTMVLEGLVSLPSKSVQKPFVSWLMVLRLMRSTNTSGSGKLQLGHV